MTTFSHFRRCLIVSICMTAPAVLHAQSDDNPWSVSLFSGESFGLSGVLHPQITGGSADLGALKPGLEGASATVDFRRLHYEDAFHPEYRTLAGLRMRSSTAKRSSLALCLLESS